MTFLESAKELVTSVVNDKETSEDLLTLKKELAEEYVQKVEKEKSDVFLSIGRDVVVDYLVDEDGIWDAFNDAFIGKAMESLSSLSGDFKHFREKLNNASTQEDLASLRNEISDPMKEEKDNTTNPENSLEEISTDSPMANTHNMLDWSSSKRVNSLEGESPYVQSVLKKAESQIGKPYVRWGTTEKWFDCSGLWNWAFKEEGIVFKDRFTAALFSHTDVNISRENLRVGDFMYWDQKPWSKKHNPIYHIEMVVSQPFQENGKWFVKTIGSSTDKWILNDQGEKTKKSWVGYRIRELTEYRHFWRPPFYHQLAAYEKTHNKEVLLASTWKVSSEMEQALVA